MFIGSASLIIHNRHTLQPCILITAVTNRKLAGQQADWEMNSLLALTSYTPLQAARYGSDWEKITTPLLIQQWEKGLRDHPDQDFAQYICTGIQRGFRVRYNYCIHQCRSRPGNIRLVSEHRDVEKYIGGECAAKRLLGPFDRSQFPHVHVSPFGVIPKSKPGKWRLILDLSSPEGGSVNGGISIELCSLSYMSIDDVAAHVVRLGRGALMAKFDLKSAYRNIPVHPDDRWLLGMVWEEKLFVDTTLLFGLRSAPIIFNAVVEALTYMRKDGIKEVDHHLHDFSLVGPPESKACQEDLDRALETCNRLCFPVAGKKWRA